MEERKMGRAGEPRNHKAEVRKLGRAEERKFGRFLGVRGFQTSAPPSFPTSALPVLPASHLQIFRALRCRMESVEKTIKAVHIRAKVASCPMENGS